MSSRSASTGVFTRSTRSARCSASRAALTRRPMPTFIPARGRTLHLAGVCVNRIGRLRTLPIEELIVVTGHLGECIEAYLREFYKGRYRNIAQERLDGTGGAVNAAKD